MRPAGLFYIPNSIPAGIDDELWQCLRDAEWAAVSTGKKSRKVLHYGYAYNYTKRSALLPTAPLPEILDHLRLSLIATVESLIAEGKIAEQNPNLTFDQCIVNKYEPGQGIGSHCDSNAFDSIIGCFTFCVHTDGNVTIINPPNMSPGEMLFLYPRDLLVPAYTVATEHGSLYIMSGDARTVWEHQMVGRTVDMIPAPNTPPIPTTPLTPGTKQKRVPRATRISITFRSLAAKK